MYLIQVDCVRDLMVCWTIVSERKHWTFCIDLTNQIVVVFCSTRSFQNRQDHGKFTTDYVVFIQESLTRLVTLRL